MVIITSVQYNGGSGNPVKYNAVALYLQPM